MAEGKTAMNNIYLRPLTIEDASISYKWRNDAEIWKYTGSRPTCEITEAMEREWAARAITSPERINFAICIEETHEYIDNIYLVNIKDGIGELGVFIGERPHWGKGHAKEAELQDLAFGTPLVENEIRKALSMPLKEIAPHSLEGHWREMVVHAQPGQQGFFDQLVIDEKVTENNLRLTDMFATRGSAVRPLSGANCSLGNIFLQFNTREELNTYIKDTRRWLKIVVDCHE